MRRIVCAVLVSLVIVSVSLAQMPGREPPDPCAALAKYLNKDAAFSASAKVVTQGKTPADLQTMLISLAVSGRRMRSEMDMTKGSGISADDMAGMKQMGMDLIVILKVPEKNAAYMVFPNLQSYCDMPASKKGSVEGTVEKIEVGPDTIEKQIGRASCRERV